MPTYCHQKKQKVTKMSKITKNASKSPEYAKCYQKLSKKLAKNVKSCQNAPKTSPNVKFAVGKELKDKLEMQRIVATSLEYEMS